MKNSVQNSEKIIKKQIKYFIFSALVIHGLLIAVWPTGSFETFYLRFDPILDPILIHVSDYHS